jgi:hypothetical protein
VDDERSLCLSRIGATSVTLVRDDEFGRYFIQVHGDVVTHIALDATDAAMLADAFQQALLELPKDVARSR